MSLKTITSLLISRTMMLETFWYLLENSYGLTTPGMGRLNRSIEAFVYCVLGAQVNMRSSIVGGGGIAQEVRQKLTQLFEKAVIEEDLSNSVQRYQEAIENSRVKLDFAVSLGVWRLPSNLAINLISKVGYNNFLRKATDKMKLGVNNVNALAPAGAFKVRSSNRLRVMIPLELLMWSKNN